MLSSHLHSVKAIMNLRLRAASERREARDLLHRSGVDQLSWLARGSRRFLGQLGCLLVVMGHWLQGLGTRPDATAFDSASGR